MNIATERTALGTLLTGKGLNLYETAPSRPDAPAVVITPEPFAAHAAMDATSTDMAFRVQILVQWGDWDSAQNDLDGFVPTVVAALEAAANVGVERIENYQSIELDGGAKYGAVTLHVLVLT